MTSMATIGAYGASFREGCGYSSITISLYGVKPNRSAIGAIALLVAMHPL